MNPHDELEETGIRRIRREILEATADAPPPRHVSGFERAEGVYRAVTSLRDFLPPDAQEQLAVCFAWAQKGIVHQSATPMAADLQALQAAYAYAQEAMLSAANSVPRD
jgi:hypothetical protein